MALRFPSGRRSRAASITLLLVLAGGFAVALALQAVGAAQHQKAQAERVLRDYSAYAANRFAVRSDQVLWYWSFVPAFKSIERTVAKHGHLPQPQELGDADDSLTLMFFKEVRSVFQLDTMSGWVTFAGPQPSEAWRRWLTDTITATMRTLPPKEDMAAVIGAPPGDEPAVAVFMLPHAMAHAPRHALGFVANLQSIVHVFDWAASSAPLVPPSLTGGVKMDSIGSVVARDARGNILYRTAWQYDSPITGHDTLGSYLAGLQVDVSLRPSSASQLVIGGLPHSRLPLLVGLLVLTTSLIVIALIQLRREYELTSLRTDFVSGVSHELRTPLAQIRMFAETLVLGRVRSDDERRRSLEIIDQEARRLTHLVENLLHFSRSERRSLRVTPTPALLGPLVRSIVESFTPLADTRHVRLRVEIADGVVAPVDEGALRQMLLNLLDNAVKYGPDGQTVTVGLAAAGDVVRLRVEDQGPGIPAGEVDRVWDQFWRLERDRGSAVAGTGIGLSVVRELATLHGGRAWVATPATGGCCFVIELPAVAETAPPRPSPTPATAPATPPDTGVPA
jgi:signal transduction histidine kinase